MKNTAITWCIENCAGYMAHEAANDEMSDIVENFERQEKEADALRTKNERLSRRVAELEDENTWMYGAIMESAEMGSVRSKIELNRIARKDAGLDKTPAPPASPQLGPHAVDIIADGIITEHKSTYQQALDKVNQPGATVEDWQNFHREAALLRMSTSSTDTRGRDEREGKNA